MEYRIVSGNREVQFGTFFCGSYSPDSFQQREDSLLPAYEHGTPSSLAAGRHAGLDVDRVRGVCLWSHLST